LFNYASPDKQGARLAAGSQACMLTAVGTFFAWLLKEQLIATNSAAALQLPKRPRNLPRNVLTRRETRRLVEATPIHKPRDIRDHALLEVLYGTGLRLSELIGLTLYDLDWEASTLRVRGKGDQTRLVPLTERARTALKLYLEEARSTFARQASQIYLFVSSRSGGPLGKADIPRIVAKAARLARLSKHITRHTLRHTYATHLLKGKADIQQIQKLLGHRRLSSTEIYTHVEISDLQEVITRCHPRGNQAKAERAKAKGAAQKPDGPK
jgi:site-specific recombinase XerD